MESLKERKRGFEIAVREIEKGANGEVLEIYYWDITHNFIPQRSTSRSAGYDFKCAEDVVIPTIWEGISIRILDTVKGFCSRVIGRSNTKDPDDHKFKPTIVHTGIKVYMQEDEVIKVYNRSSGPVKLGLVLANSVGIVDSDYYGNDGNDGEIMFAFYNFFPWEVKINKGDKIGQGVFSKFLKADWDDCGGERTGGYGSTGR